MTLKERFLKIKAAFDGTPPVAPAQPAAAATPPAAPAPAPLAGKTYKLQDGTEISISQAGDLPAAGDMVTINGAPAPANTYTLSDGSTITVDATGAITAYMPAAAPAPSPAPPAPAPAPPQPVTLSAEQVRDMYAKFATGTPEERLMGLEVMVKALMECNFGWKIREGNENQAIEVYKDTLGTAAAPAMPSMEDMSSMFAKAEKFDAQTAIINRHEETIKLLLELTQQLVELPTEDPKTLTGTKKENFDRAEKREKKFESIAAALKQVKTNN